MIIDIKAPQFPESIADGTVATWHKRPGDACRRDEVLVDVETDKGRAVRGIEYDAGLFNGLAARAAGDGGIAIGFDVTAGQQPAVQAPMVNEQHGWLSRMNDAGGGGHVARRELVAGKGIGRFAQQLQNQFAAFPGLAIALVLPGGDQRLHGKGFEHL